MFATERAMRFSTEKHFLTFPQFARTPVDAVINLKTRRMARDQVRFHVVKVADAKFALDALVTVWIIELIGRRTWFLERLAFDRIFEVDADRIIAVFGLVSDG